MEGGWEGGEKDAEMIAEILNEFGLSCGKILDLGCGIGRISLRLAEKGYEVVGVDLSKLCVERASSFAEKLGVEGKARFIQGDYFKLENINIIGKEKFNAILFIKSTSWSDSQSKEKFQNLYLKLHEYATENSVIVLQDMCRELFLSAILSAPTALNWFEVYGNLLYLNKWKLNPAKQTLLSIKEIYEEVDGGYKLLERIERCSYLPSLYDYAELLEKAGWEVLKITRPFSPNFEISNDSCDPWSVYSFLMVARKRMELRR